jgi:uncharacterized repeat protein (TIGR02543 family)
MNKKSAFRPTGWLFPLFAALLIMTGCGPDPFYIQVALIEGVPETGEAGTPLTLTGTIRPTFASNKDIIWSVKNTGTTGASINGNILNTNANGIVIIRAKVANGMAEGKEYIQDFIINIAENGSRPAILATYYDVTFESDGGSAVASQRVEEGRYAARPDDPVKAGFGFNNWYSDPDLTAIYNFNSPITGNITLYAKWIRFISNIDIIITGPGTGEEPDTAAAANGSVSYTIGPVSWSPSDNLFMGLSVYTATVTVTANAGSIFTGTLTAEINSHAAAITGRTDTTVTISHTFDPTLAKVVINIEIYSQPVKTTYTHGDTIDLSGLSVKLTYNDNTTDIFALEDFGDIISENPSNSSTLSYTMHNDHPVKVSIGRHDAYTDKLTINKAMPAITFPTAAPITYGMTLAHSALTDGSSTPPGSFKWVNGAIIPTVINSGYSVEFTPIDPDDKDNYDYSSYGANWNGAEVTQIIDITVFKAPGAAVGIPVITGDADALSITVNPLTSPVSGQSVEYAINTTSGVPADGWQDETIFGGLSLDTEYYIFARSKTNDNYLPGMASISSDTITFHTVTFDSNGGSAVTARNVVSGTAIIAPSDPIKGLYYFGGWYRESELTTEWNFTTNIVTASITLYAKWIQNTVTIILSMEQITSADPAIGNITVSRTGSGGHAVTAEVSIDAGLYDPGSIKWEISGVGVYAGSSITGTEAAFTIDAANEKYNTTGGHVLRLEVKKDGVTYRVNINFYIVD